MEKKYFEEYGCRFTYKERMLFESNGLYVYSIRDNGVGAETLENKVLVNHIGDVVTNFKIEEHFRKAEDYEDVFGNSVLVMSNWQDKLFFYCDVDDTHTLDKKVKKLLKSMEG